MDTSRRKELFIGAGFVVIIVALMIFAGVASSGKSAQQARPFTGTQTSAITADDHTKGPLGATVSVIEYGDFQCPACGAYEPIVERLESEYAGRVQFVFRNFPLYQVHKNAETASMAAEAAGMQSKYWEMHDLLYQKQAEWSEVSTGSVVAEYFDKYAASLGLDVKKFDADLKSDTVKAKIQKDVTGANAAQVDHTPTFFINLTQIQNPKGYDEFKSLIDAALASSTSAQ
ncbi:DsbA family protein [Candidatus Kaiserbacteria bacterium]|nr:DsbA family protein [Candidatus Kaiserbacteria bacterium]